MILYQYRSINGKAKIGYLMDLLVRGALKFSKPSEFNDPYDCCPTQLSEVPDGALRHAVGNYMNKFLQRARSEMYGVVCLTPYPDRMLMWSHYGDQHRGVCVGFDSDILATKVPVNDMQNPLHSQPVKVIYTDTRPTGDDSDALIKKATPWSYEEEHRIISCCQPGEPEWGPGVNNISPSAITEIVIGAEMADEEKMLITEFVRAERSDISIKQAILHMKNYELVIEPYDGQPSNGPGVGFIQSPNQKWKPIK